MAIRGGYAPPGVYTETVFESPTPQSNFSGDSPFLSAQVLRLSLRTDSHLFVGRVLP